MGNVEPRIARAIVGALRERDRSGHEIWQWLGPVHGAQSELTEANLYPTLYALEAEGIVESYWREDQRIRRAYRLAGSGLDAALANSWAAVARRRRSAGEDGGGWHLDASPTWRAPGGGGTDGTDGTEEAAAVEATAGVEAAGVPQAAPVLREADSVAPEPGASRPNLLAEQEIDRYVEEVGSALDLDDLHGREVLTELADHLHDAASVDRSIGAGADDAAAAAVEALGPPSALAAAINAAQRSRRRLSAGMRWGSAVASLSFLVVFGVTTCALFLATPFIFFALHVVAALCGFDLYLPTSDAVGFSQMLLPAALASFVAARRSITHVAVRARRSEAALAPAWAAAGAVPLALIALALPISADPVVVASVVGLPLLWIAGSLRPVGIGGELLSARGTAVAVAALIAALALPGAHAWLYHSADLPAAAPPMASSAGVAGLRVEWKSDLNGVTWNVTLEGFDEQRWTDARLEVWPVVRDGAGLHPDATAAGPVHSAPLSDALDFGNVPGAADEWLVLVTATETGGDRATVYSEVRTGDQHPRHAPLPLLLLGR